MITSSPDRLRIARRLAFLAAAMPLVAGIAPRVDAADLGPGRRPYPTFERSTTSSYDEPAMRPGIWPGFYAGINGGYAWGSLDPFGRSDGVDLDSGTLGGHVGYNLQLDRFVIGAEGDLGWRWASGSRSYADPAHLDGEASLLSSLRLRAGFAFDNVLVYGTGGVAFGRFETDLTSLAGLASTSETFAGYVFGGGLEMKITSSLSGRVEALHYGFDDKTFDFSGGAMRSDLSTSTIRAGISYHFN
ncbi:MAG: outer membrane protein [Hyphomicrobiaceae bacterium]|nr:outer membrane protein [Hyphomicrobiaceae bacterium]